MLPYVDAAVVVTVIHVLLFLLHVCMLIKYEGVRVTAMLVWGVEEVVVSIGHVDGTRVSGIMSREADVLVISVVRGMRGVGEVCDMCMCLARGGVGGQGDE